MQHGTKSAYERHACRCDACREWKRGKDRALRERRKQLAAEGGHESVPHGTEPGYSKYYCRCDPCSAAYAASIAKWREENPERVARYKRMRQATRDAAARAGLIWTGAELEQVLRRDVPLERLAVMLGRSYDACSVARHKATHDPKWMQVVGTPREVWE